MADARRPGEVRRPQIARAAVRVIGARGLRGFTTANVAREAGVSEANLYRHFRSKDSILEAVISEIEKDLGGNLEKISREKEPALARLEKAFRHHIEYVEKNPGVPRIVFSSETVLLEGLKKRLLSFVTGYLGVLSGIVEAGKREGCIRGDTDAEASAVMLIGMVQLSAFRGVLSGRRKKPQGDVERLWGEFRRSIEA